MNGAAAEMQTRSRYVTTARRKAKNRTRSRARDPVEGLRSTAGIVADRDVSFAAARSGIRAGEGPPASAPVPVPAPRRLLSRSRQRRVRGAPDERGDRLVRRHLQPRRGDLLPELHAVR